MELCLHFDIHHYTKKKIFTLKNSALIQIVWTPRGSTRVGQDIKCPTQNYHILYLGFH